MTNAERGQVNDAFVLRERRDAELDLLFAMYPDQLQWQDAREELTYTSEQGTLVLRISGGYLWNSHPTIVSASGTSKQDLRDQTTVAVKSLDFPIGEEILDAILQAFDGLATLEPAKPDVNQGPPRGLEASKHAQTSYKTIVVWLHHLLNTSKRKLALSPSTSPNQVVGTTRPGYPGVLVFSGNRDAVEAHVAELKAERWQAFQVRLEETADAPWSFVHKTGIVEVETVGDVAQTICEADRREQFLKAIGVK